MKLCSVCGLVLQDKHHVIFKKNKSSKKIVFCPKCFLKSDEYKSLAEAKVTK